MYTTILNIPGFQRLPKGVKQMLLFSEEHFFEQPAPHNAAQKGAAQEMRTKRRLEDDLPKPFILVRIAMEAPA